MMFPLEMYEKTIWHELSHDINKSIIDSSPKLQEEIKRGQIYLTEPSKIKRNKIEKARLSVIKDYPRHKDKILKEFK